MQSVAWWVLNTKKENRFLAEEIPTELVPASIRANRATAAAVREAIVGSVIEPISRTGVLGSKARKYYFFPHKSYLEFLVASYFENHRFTIDVYREFMRNVNNEILLFLEESPRAEDGTRKGVALLREGLLHTVGSVDFRVIEVCATDPEVKREVENKNKQNWHASKIYTHYVYLKGSSLDAEPYLLARLGDSVTTDSMSATFACIASELCVLEVLDLPGL